MYANHLPIICGNNVTVFEQVVTEKQPTVLNRRGLVQSATLDAIAALDDKISPQISPSFRSQRWTFVAKPAGQLILQNITSKIIAIRLHLRSGFHRTVLKNVTTVLKFARFTSAGFFVWTKQCPSN